MISNQKQKVLAILTILLLIFNLVVPIVSNAEGNTSIEFENPAGEGKEILVGTGETFTVNVNFANPVEGAIALAGIVKFDSTKLELTNKVYDADGSYILTGYNSLGNYVSAVEWNEIENPTDVTFAFRQSYGKLSEGLAFPLTFKVKDGATGTFDIEFSNVQYSDAAEVETTYPIQIGEKVTGRIKVPLESISLNKTQTTIGVGASEQLTVIYNPEETTDNKNVTWSSDKETIAKVDNNGKVIGVNPGTAIITAKCGEETATCTVNVTSKLQSISLDKTSLELAKGQSQKLTVTYNPQNTTDSKNVTWTSSNPNVATVDEQGNVTAVANGTAVITAKSEVTGVKDATCTVNVTSKLQHITLNKTEVNLNKGNKEKLTVEFYPEDTTDSKNVTWSVIDDKVATVDGNGTITAVNAGTTTVIATCGDKTAQATVTVKSPLVSIDIGNDFELLPEQEKQLTVIYNPDDTTDSKTTIWESSNKEVATVSSQGLVKAIKPGITTITATCGKVTDTLEVTVLEVPLVGIAFDKVETTLEKGKGTKLNVKFYPENTTDERTIEWSSDKPNVVEVDAEGNITAKSAGTAKIQAKVGDETITCTVTVVVPLTGIKLDTTKIDLNKGESTTIKVSYLPEDTTDDKTIVWTSKNPSVATVKNGTIKAISAGTAIIEAKVGDFTESCTVNVKVPLTEISIKESANLIKGQSEKLVVTYNPTDTTDNKTVVWTSKNPEIVTVDENGVIEGQKEGTAIVIAKVGEFESECKVTVKEIKLEGIKIDNKIDELVIGETAKLDVIYTPENTTDDKAVMWSSSDEDVLTVDENGNVTAVGVGKATITVTSGNFKDSYEVEVKGIDVVGVEINVENTTLKEGDSLKLNISYLPTNATEGLKVIYISSDESVLTVDEEGNVTAKRPGKAIVTVITETGIRSQVELTVQDEEQPQDPDIDDENTDEDNNSENNPEKDKPLSFDT